MQPNDSEMRTAVLSLMTQTRVMRRDATAHSIINIVKYRHSHVDEHLQPDATATTRLTTALENTIFFNHRADPLLFLRFETEHRTLPRLGV